MKFLSALLIITIAVSSCNLIDGRRIKGNGKITTKNYDLKDFDGIDIGGAKSLHIKLDSVYSVRVETDENIFNHLRVSVRDGELKVQSKDGSWLNPTDGVKIFVSLPVLKKLEVSGASTVKTEGKILQDEKLAIKLSGASEGNLDVRIPEIGVTASGASSITMSGESRDLVVDAKGASTFDGFDLKAENTRVDASGASTGNVFASINLKATASGASDVKYKGNPKVIENTSGASSVKKAAP